MIFSREGGNSMGRYKVQVKVQTRLHLRTGPSTSYEVIGYLYNGEQYTSSKQSNNWYFIDSMNGWSSGQYLDVLENLDGNNSVNVPYVPDEKTTAANTSDKSLGIDAKVLEMLLGSLKKEKGKIDASLRLFGAPHQFTYQTDFRPGGEKYSDMGRKYIDAIAAESPIVHFLPGRPNFLPDLAKDESDALREFFGKQKPGDKTNQDMLDKILGNKDARYFDFITDYSTYIRYVNLLCRTASIYMGLGDEEAPIKAFKQKYKWFDWSNYRYGDSYVAKEKKTESIFEEVKEAKDDALRALFGDWQYIQFYADPRMSFQESASNQTAESALANLVQSGSQKMKEASFFLQTGAMGNASQWLTDSAQSWNEAMTKLGNDGIMSRLADIGTTVLSGGNILFPEIWGNSAYNKSYNITINLTSPYGDKESVYLNVIVPLMHLMALALPRQVSANSFTTPFLVKVSSKGWFNCEMGMIDNISIEKVAGSFTVNGLPTEVKVSISIKDLYSSLMITKNTEPGLFFKNTGLVNWLAITCGMDITKPAFEEKFYALLMTLFNSVADVPNDLSNIITEKLKETVGKLWKH